MRKIILLCVLMLLAQPCLAEPPIHKVRKLYLKAAENEKACKKLIGMLNEYENNPLLRGYKGSALMMMANHVFNPFRKLSYFKRGQAMLNRAIKAAEMNVELRFLRLMAQIHAPDFLGYDDYINSDKKHLIYLLSKTNNNALEAFIIPKVKQLNIFNENKFEILTDYKP